MNLSILREVEKVGARTEKERLLATVGEETKRFLKLVADPFTTMGTTVSDERITSLFAARDGGMQEGQFWDHMFELLNKLAKRELTGNAATEAIDALLLAAPDPACLQWGARLVNQDLRLNVATKTILKVFPGLVEPFQVQLAHPYDPGKHMMEGHWAVEPKLDGLRMVVLDGKAYSRNGKDITSCGHILAQLGAAMALSDWVLDGEVMGEEFNAASGQVRQKNGTSENLIYHVFDVVKRAEWASRETAIFGARRLDLEDLAIESLPNVRIAPHTQLQSNPSAAALFAERDRLMVLGFEGAMLKNLKAQYQFKRTNDLLKVKDFADADGRVVAVFEGNKKYKGMLGGFDVEFDGVITQVGSGFTDEQRRYYWASQLGVINKTVEVKFQNLTPDRKLRFPVFMRFRPDKD